MYQCSRCGGFVEELGELPIQEGACSCFKEKKIYIGSDLAHRLSKIVHDNCNNIRHDIGLILVSEIEKYISEQ